MIVSNKAALQRIAGVYREQKQTERVRKEKSNLSFNDEVSLSTEGKELQAMVQKLKDVPAIRPQSEEIKVAVQEGTYKVSPQNIARGILAAWERSE